MHTRTEGSKARSFGEQEPNILAASSLRTQELSQNPLSPSDPKPKSPSA